jgi:hypothetical protein
LSVVYAEAVAAAGFLEWLLAIDEDRGVVDLVFLAEFGKNHRCGGSRPLRRERDVQYIVRVGVDRSVQRGRLFVELVHGPVDRDVGR